MPMKGDRITIATQNVRGLGQGFTGRRKRQELKDLFKNTTPATDILLLQETKIPEAACLNQARFIEFRGGSSLWNEAAFSAQSARYKGGTGMVLSERMATSITQHGVLYPGRAQYATFQLSTNLHIGILNVYGYSDTGPRAALWNHLAQVQLPEAKWILAGDFNNIEQSRDKQGGSSKTSISRREMEAWNRLLIRLGVRDAFRLKSFRKLSEKVFTWSNGRNDETMIQTRIDRIYVPTQLEEVGGTIEALPTLPDISDHASVVLHFEDEPRRKPTVPFFNKGLLANPGNKACLLTAWKNAIGENSQATWNQKMVAANTAIRQKSVELTKAQKKQWKETYKAQFDDIKEAEAELQRNWGSREARNQLSDAQAAIHEVRQQKFQFKECAILSKWARVGDRCTKEFFEHHTGARRPIAITQMKDGERTLTSQADIEAHILQFYENLYTRDEQVENDEAAREECLRLIKQTVLP
jgi:exonuclease III